MSKHDYTLSNMSKHTSENTQVGWWDRSSDRELNTDCRERIWQIRAAPGLWFIRLLWCACWGFQREREREEYERLSHRNAVLLQIINSILDHNSFWQMATQGIRIVWLCLTLPHTPGLITSHLQAPVGYLMKRYGRWYCRNSQGNNPNIKGMRKRDERLVRLSVRGKPCEFNCWKGETRN